MNHKFTVMYCWLLAAVGSPGVRRFVPGAVFVRDVVPILGLSKPITAAGIMKLVESGALDLDWKVFGPRGILSESTGPDGFIVDPAVEEITVRHLLHHTAGWDETKGPVYDPMHNHILINSDIPVVNIKEALGLKEGEPDQFDILTFMLGQPLDSLPGTRAKPSNFGYSMLGRVIEEITGLPYEYWIKKNILEPAGMWHTRIGPSASMVTSLIIIFIFMKEIKSQHSWELYSGHDN